MNGVSEPVHPQAEAQNQWRQTVQLLARQEGNQGLVIGFDTDLFSQDLVGKLFSSPGYREWRPVAYASRSMMKTERRYAQIEKEAPFPCLLQEYCSQAVGRCIG